jgi:hypothetical protein
VQSISESNHSHFRNFKGGKLSRSGCCQGCCYGNWTFKNFLFQQGYHRADWLSRVKIEKGVVEASFLACLMMRLSTLVF